MTMKTSAQARLDFATAALTAIITSDLQPPARGMSAQHVAVEAWRHAEEMMRHAPKSVQDQWRAADVRYHHECGIIEAQLYAAHAPKGMKS